MERLPPTLTAQRQLLAKRLHHPLSVDIELREIPVGKASGLLIFVDGLVSVESLQAHVLLPLPDLPGSAPDVVAARIPVLRQEFTADVDRLLQGILAGSAALLVEGWTEAALLDVGLLPDNLALDMSPNRRDDIFGRDARRNLALVRKVLRDPAFMAQRVTLKRPRAGPTMLLYMEGRAKPSLVRAVRRWAFAHLGEEAVQRGLAPGIRAVLGLVPHLSAERWPDKVAALISAGHVVLLVDGSIHAFAAPVTIAGDLYSPSDCDVHYAMRRWLVRIRLCVYYLVLTAPATVIALLNYHQEMIPTSFLLAVASARENAAFGIFFEVLFLELLVDLAREASFRLEVALPIGAAMVTNVLLITLGVLAGFIGPISGMASALGALASAALPGYSGAYIVRLWRYYMIFAAVIFGFFGMAALLAVFLALLCYSRPWGVPFLGPSGWMLTAPEASAAHGPKRKGRKPNGTVRSAVR